MSSPDEIKYLLDLGYKADSAPKLEALVNAQVNGETPYCFEANRTLLKLYQFFPQLQEDGTTARILLLSLLKFPSTDLLALLCIVPERVQTREPSVTIIRCVYYLSCCDYVAVTTVNV
jgi:translation initiation factor 3 subunit K